MAESLLGYTVVNSAYTAGVAGAVNGTRTALPGTFNAGVQLSGLNGDPALNNFLDPNGASRLVLRQYNYGAAAEPYQIHNPATLPWSSVATGKVWSALWNLYSVATAGDWLYAIDYDLANIAVIDMFSDVYTQSASYNFPTYFNTIEGSPIVPAGNQNNGVAVVIVGTSLYALFTTVDDPWAANPVYQKSTIVRMSINTSTGVLSYTAGDYVKVGKNAFTLEHHDGKLYVSALGGAQQGSAANADTLINVVNLGTFPAASSVTTPITPISSGVSGDYRDISIIDDNNVFVLAGHYASSFATLTGGVYKTTIANLAAGSLGTKVIDISNAGYFWGLHAEDVSGGTDRLWFFRGDPVEIYAPLPASTSATYAKAFAPAALGSSSVNAHLNSATLIQPSTTALTGVKAFQAAPARVAKSFAPHAILASQARKAAETLKATSEAAAAEEKK